MKKYLKFILITLSSVLILNCTEKKENTKIKVIDNGLEKSLSTYWTDIELYSRYKKFLTLNLDDGSNDMEISLDINDSTSTIIGYKTKDGELILMYRGNVIGLEKTEYKKLSNDNSNKHLSYEIFETSSVMVLSYIKKIIIYEVDGYKCGSFINLEMYDNEGKLLLKKDGKLKYLSICD